MMTDDLRRTVERQAARLQTYCELCGREISGDWAVCSDCIQAVEEITNDAAAVSWREQMARREAGDPMMAHMDIYDGEE